jgi:hypothetical protein
VIRRTVAKAFGGSPAGKSAPPWPPEEAAGGAAIERFLRDLHRAIEGRAEEEAGEGRGPPRLTRPETLPEGVEFVLAGDGVAVRFLDTLLGFVRVIISVRDGDAVEEALSLQPHGGTQRPVWKPLAGAGGGPSRSPGRRRTAFRFTSVADLAARYAAIAAGERGEIEPGEAARARRRRNE